jgi:hypothetical protein
MSEKFEGREDTRVVVAEDKLQTVRRLCKHDSYLYDKSEGLFWDIETGSLHTKESVDASIPTEYWTLDESAKDDGEEGDARPRGPGRPKKRRKLIAPSREIMRVERDLFVEGSCYWPGMPRIIHDWQVDATGYHHRPGFRTFNHYRSPPVHSKGCPGEAKIWVDHIKHLWPDEEMTEFFFNYFAHMLQRTDEKCNGGIVLSGQQGIGKDSAILPLRGVVGEWNCRNIEPDQLFAQFQSFRQTVLLIVDEVRDSKDEHRPTAMYDALKILLASPPDTFPINEKYQMLRYAKNVLRVIMTTNTRLSLYIPPDDRRVAMMHSPLPPGWHIKAGDPDYFVRLYNWMEKEDGIAHVSAFLRDRDISKFNPKASVPRSRAWSSVSASWGEPDDCVAKAILGIQEREWRHQERAREEACEAKGEEFVPAAMPDDVPDPPIIIGWEMIDALLEPEEILSLMKHPRKLSHRMAQRGYELVPSKNTGGWKFSKKDPSDPSKPPFTIRSKYVFVLASIDVGGDAELNGMIQERGKILVERKAGIKGNSTSNTVIPFAKPPR